MFSGGEVGRCVMWWKDGNGGASRGEGRRR